MVINLHEFECFWYFSLRLITSFSPLWSEKLLDMISIFLNFLRLVLYPMMWSVFENVPCTFEKNVHFVSLGWKALYISVHFLWSRILFNAAISLWIFCLEDLFSFESEVLKFLTIIVLLSMSFLKSSKIFLMYLGAPMLGEYIFTMFTSSSWILRLSIVNFWVSFYGPLLKSILSDMCVAIPVLFVVVFPVHLPGIFVSSPSLLSR